MLPAAPLTATLMVLFQTFCRSSWSSWTQKPQNDSQGAQHKVSKSLQNFMNA